MLMTARTSLDGRDQQRPICQLRAFEFNIDLTYNSVFILAAWANNTVDFCNTTLRLDVWRDWFYGKIHMNFEEEIFI